MRTRVAHHLALAGWWVANAAFALALLTYSMPEFVKGVAESLRSPSVNALYTMLQPKFAPALPASAPMTAALMLATLFVVFMSISWLYQHVLARFSLSALSVQAGAAIRWGAGRFFGSALFWLTASLLVASVAASRLHYDSPLWVVISSAWALAVTVLPTFALNQQFLSRRDNDYMRALQWPGFTFAALWLGLFIVVLMLDMVPLLIDPLFVLLKVDAPIGSMLTMSICWGACYVVGLHLRGTVLSLIINRRAFAYWRDEFKHRTAMRFVVAWLLLDLRFGVILAWLLPPYFLLAFASVYVLPQLQQTIVVSGNSTGSWLLSALGIGSWLLTYSWPALWLLAIPLTMINGRFLLGIDNADTGAPC